MKRPCVRCAKPFESKFSGARFCSAVCHFWFHTPRSKKDGCWEWTGVRRKGSGGYGVFTRDDVLFHAHRFSYELHKGAIPPGLFVLHRCDNPPCCNPKHLFVGTAADNIHDAMRKGRHKPPPRHDGPYEDKSAWHRGAQHYAARLSEAQAKEILRSKKRGSELARQYGVRATTISMLRRGKTWRHLPRPIAEIPRH